MAPLFFVGELAGFQTILNRITTVFLTGRKGAALYCRRRRKQHGSDGCRSAFRAVSTTAARRRRSDGSGLPRAGGPPIEPGSEAERQAAIEALKREAAEYAADAIVDVRFEVDDVRGVDIDGVALQRVTVSGLAVRFARAA